MRRPRTFNAEAAVAACDEALSRVGHRESTYVMKALVAALIQIARDYKFFTSEDVWKLAFAYNIYPTEPRVMGALLRYASAQKWCKATKSWKTSTMVSCHARPMRVWRSLIGGGR